jgi:hypothetical protein
VSENVGWTVPIDGQFQRKAGRSITGGEVGARVPKCFSATPAAGRKIGIEDGARARAQMARAEGGKVMFQ